MKKRKCIVIMIVIISIAVLGGCGVKNLSGTFISDLDDNVYIKFSSKSKVTFHNELGTMEGTYRISKNVVSISFPDSEKNAYMYFEVKDKNTLYLDYTVAFVKKSFWSRHWKKTIIGILVLGVISIVYEKITGRSLEDDLDRL